MSDTRRKVDYSALHNMEHWERFGIKSRKHLTKDRNSRAKDEKFCRYMPYPKMIRLRKSDEEWLKSHFCD